jgi:hypothetical protein
MATLVNGLPWSVLKIRGLPEPRRRLLEDAQ